MSAPANLAPHIARAEAVLNEYVARPAWDGLAGMHDTRLPAVGDPGRLSAIRNDLARHYFEFRGLFGGVERWQVPFDASAGWDERLGLPGITDPESDVSRESMAYIGALGLAEPMKLPEGLKPRLIGALGCAGISLGQRVQKQWGLEITKVGADGSFSFGHVPNEQAHPALRDQGTLRFTTASFRALGTKPQLLQGGKWRSEVDEVRGFAEGAQTEFDLSVAATRHALGGRTKRTEIELDDPGYPFEGRKGVIVTHEVGDELRAVNIGAPLPAKEWRERDRAQTPHTYAALKGALEVVAPGLLVPDAPIALVTNASYGPFQYVAAVNASIEAGWIPHMTAVADGETGLDRLADQLQLRKRMEVFSLADQLTHLDNHLQELRAKAN